MVTAEMPRVVRLHSESFEDFYGTRWDEVYRPLALTLRDPGLAREAVDEAMVRAYAQWKKVREFRNQEGWIYRVAFNWAISQKRKQRREVYGNDPVDREVSALYPDTDMEAALARLTVEQRAVVVLRYLLDWTEEDVAEALDIARGTVKSRLNRAITHLREDLT